MRMPARRVSTPSQGDGIARLATEVIGGPAGRYAGAGRRGWTFVAAVCSALSSVVVALAVPRQGYCVQHGWSTPGSLWRECYSDLAIGTTGQMTSTPWAGGGVGARQPPLTALLAWGLQWFVPSGSAVQQEQRYFMIGAAVIAILIAVTVVATASIARSTPWLAAHVALSPVLITASLISFDTFGVALATLGLAAWARRRPTLAGALLGAAVMARSYPLIIVAALVMVSVRRRRGDDIGRLLIGVIAVVAVLIGLTYAMGGNPWASYAAWNSASASYGSFWLLLQIVHVTIPAHALTALAVIGWVVALLVGAYLTSRADYPVRVAPLALTMLVIVLVTGKAFTIQSCLWVLPLIALAALRWREHLTWAGVELTYFVMTWMYVAYSSNPDKALPAGAYAVFAAVRLIAYGGIAWTSWETSEDLPDPLQPAAASPPPRPAPTPARPAATD